MRWAQPAPPSRPCPSSRPPPRDKGRLVSRRRASGGRTSLSQGRCAGQKPAELAPRTPYLGSLGLCRGRGAGAAPAAPGAALAAAAVRRQQPGAPGPPSWSAEFRAGDGGEPAPGSRVHPPRGSRAREDPPAFWMLCILRCGHAKSFV